MRDRQTDRHSDRLAETAINRDTERNRNGDRHRQTDRERHRERKTETETGLADLTGVIAKD